MLLMTKILYRLALYSVACSFLFPGIAKGDNGIMLFNALIDDAIQGCEIRLAQNVLSFEPLLASQITGNTTTYQIKPLRLQLACLDVNKVVQPRLTLEGETPYSGVAQNTVFLTGTPNGVGFMVRYSADNQPINPSDFYSPTKAIGSGGPSIPLARLNQENSYQGEALLWIGLVGPLQAPVIPGQFHASLIINVVFQ